jgi:flagellar biosynthesis GTPase FlhF
MSDSLHLDPNKIMVRLAQTHVPKNSIKLEQDQEGQSKDKEKLKSLHNKTSGETKPTTKLAETQEDDEKTASSEIRQAFRKNKMKLIQKTQISNLDSLDNEEGDDNPQQLNNIILNDTSSLASSITTNTTDRHPTHLPHQLVTPVKSIQI